MLGIETHIHLRTAQHHDRFPVKEVPQGVGVAFVGDAGQFPGFFVDRQGTDRLGVLLTAKLHGGFEGGEAVGSRCCIHRAGLNHEGFCSRRLDGKTFRDIEMKQPGRLLQHLPVDQIDRIDEGFGRFMAAQGQFDPDASQIADRDGNLFHEKLRFL